MTDELHNIGKLAGKIAKAALEVGGALAPDKRNQEQRYDYISADKILSLCGQALFSQGVVVFPNVTGQDVKLFEYTDQYGKAKKRYDAVVNFAMTVTDGEATFTSVFTGMGNDYVVPDKALYKAITSGHKYFLMKLLCIGAGNEDSEHEPEQEKPAARPQLQKPNGNGKQQPPPPPDDEQPPERLEYTREDAALPAMRDAPAAPGKMSLETALNVTNSEGIRYGDIESGKLSHMTAGIGQALRKPNLTDEARAEYEYKLDAIRVILANRTN
ncbi:MAG: hypothetical protein GYA36_16260 [Veillonellaceae bacterium]|nr:hypothetical protein [Veillonellaceae bacterium]